MSNVNWRSRLQTRESRARRWRWAIVGFILGAGSCYHQAHATECPPGVPRCKVLILTPDMEQAMTGQNMILDTAEWGNRAGLGQAVQFFKKAIETAPAGEIKKPEEPKK